MQLFACQSGSDLAPQLTDRPRCDTWFRKKTARRQIPVDTARRDAIIRASIAAQVHHVLAELARLHLRQHRLIAERQDANAPWLFDGENLPVCQPALEIIQSRERLAALEAKRYTHTAVRLLEDEEKACRLVECLVNRWGVKRISRELNVSPHTVRAARRALAAQGKLAPYKQRVVEKMEDAIEAGLDKYLEGVENGSVSAAQIPVGLGIISDKRALALGEPTSIAASAGVQDDLSVEKLNAYLASLKTAKSDYQSSGNGDISKQITLLAAPDASLDASAAQPSPDAATVLVAAPGAPAGPPDATQEGGGGVRASARVANADSLGPEILTHKRKD